jgi:RNA polymerase sigma-70 factor (ECF subfamily)
MKRVRAERPRKRHAGAVQTRLLAALVHALQSRDQDALLRLLAGDATWTSDGGGKVHAARKPIRGAARVARFAVGVFRKLIADVEFRPIVVNAESGIAILYRGCLFSVLTIQTDGRRIREVYAIMNPQKLHTARIALH